MTGRLAGIARHVRPRAPIEVIDAVDVTVDGGLDGDHRGTIKPGGRGRRQVTLIEARDWDQAMAEVGQSLPWWHRRANLLVEAFDLPQRPDLLVRIGDQVVLRVTVECEPCSRMDEVAPGLRAALTPDWRGGICTKVIAGGTIRVGDTIRIET